MSILTDLTIHEAHKLLKERKISSVELTDAFLENIDHLERKISYIKTLNNK